MRPVKTGRVGNAAFETCHASGLPERVGEGVVHVPSCASVGNVTHRSLLRRFLPRSRLAKSSGPFETVVRTHAATCCSGSHSRTSASDSTTTGSMGSLSRRSESPKILLPQRPGGIPCHPVLRCHRLAQSESRSSLRPLPCLPPEDPSAKHSPATAPNDEWLHPGRGLTADAIKMRAAKPSFTRCFTRPRNLAFHSIQHLLTTFQRNRLQWDADESSQLQPRKGPITLRQRHVFAVIRDCGVVVAQ